jgi:hypothetical protein
VEVPDRVRCRCAAVVYEVDGEQYIAIVTGGNSIQRSATATPFGPSR